MKLHIHFGPGNHEHLLKWALADLCISYSYTKNWPEYKYSYQQTGKKEMNIVKSRSYRFLSYILHGIWNKLSFLNQGHLDILYRYYDKLAAASLPEVDILIAWSQVSLYTIRKAKSRGTCVILEHPMVHVNTWMALMTEEYANYGMKGGTKYSLLSSSMVKRMLKEYEEADFINVISTYTKQTFIDNGIPEGKLILTPLGIDTSVFKPTKRGSGKQDFKFLFVGRLELLKGVHYLLQAFSELKLPKAELILAGRILPEMEPYLKKYQGCYRYVGIKKYEELPGLYQQADVLVLPSVQEAFGLVMTEALACGVPVIATENTGAQDVIKEGVTGFIIPIRNVNELKVKIKFCYDNPGNINKMEHACVDSINRNFSLNNYKVHIKDLLAV